MRRLSLMGASLRPELIITAKHIRGNGPYYHRPAVPGGHAALHPGPVTTGVRS
jgi:hypothetical protein